MNAVNTVLSGREGSEKNRTKGTQENRRSQNAMAMFVQPHVLKTLARPIPRTPPLTASNIVPTIVSPKAHKNFKSTSAIEFINEVVSSQDEVGDKVFLEDAARSLGAG